MNAMLPVSLDDKYCFDARRIFLTGTQALVRLPLIQKRMDVAHGLDTAGFVTGYRGSPLGGYDQALAQAARHLKAADIRFQPGINEDLAATVVLGTQQINLFEKARKQGVFSIWYAKGPGVDRSGDALRHGNLAGSSPHGGVLLLAGDDHTCKSSTTSHQSEFAFLDAMIPVLSPAGVAEIIAFGLYGWALSRYSGCWSALKLVAETVDSSESVHVDREAVTFVAPAFAMPPAGVNIRWPDTPQEQERRLHNVKIPSVLAFARANRIDQLILGAPKARLGIVTLGKSYLDVRQALELLGLSANDCRSLGIAVYKVGLAWPLEPEGLKAFATGLEDLIVVEEKRPLVEQQVKDILYGLPAGCRPRVTGKRDDTGHVVLPAHDDLSPTMIARVIANALLRRHDDARIRAALDALDVGRAAPPVTAELLRTPYFCSGCPHNTSTRVPEGSRAMAGIGCHWMSQMMDRNTATYTHMGAEGANWIGQAPFVETPHVFQNIGDGTYFHSGLLAIRAAVAARVNITYKILFNDAVAMTGGQRHDGYLDPPRIANQVRAEGVERIAVVSDNIEKYAGTDIRATFPPGVTFHPREDLDAVQRVLRDLEGASVLIYDQTCAAEKRRRRKRGLMPDPDKRVVINELVCEACGDCSKKSNCLSIVPIDTEFGAKRRIDQSSCNKDYSCVNGFCPSFITVEGGKLRRARPEISRELDDILLPEPAAIEGSQPYNILVTGVGGTGVVTVGAILAMAAHIEGKGCTTLDMAGLAQKGGPVTSHIRIASAPGDINAVRIDRGTADLVIGCDLVVAGSKDAMSLIAPRRTRVVLNAEETITADFIRNRDFRVPRVGIVEKISALNGTERTIAVDAGRIVANFIGDSIATNMFMVGYAYQHGALPVSAPALDAAITLNGTAVEVNRRAFRLGRIAAHDSAVLATLSNSPAPNLDHRRLSNDLKEVIARRRAFLIDYQNEAYAERYAATISAVERAERVVTGQVGLLTESAARSLFKLMAYKDEYEVARLYSGEAIKAQLRETFESWDRVSVHLAPPLLARHDSATGAPRKMQFGPWVFRLFGLLARLKGLRGTAFDPFGYTAERRAERRTLSLFEITIADMCANLRADNLTTWIAIMKLGENVRGYGHIKAKAMEHFEARLREARQLSASPSSQAAE